MNIKQEEIITFLVENNGEILKEITPLVLSTLDDGDFDDVVQDALKEYLLVKFELNYLEVFEILDEVQIEPLKSLYYLEEYYLAPNMGALH